MVTLSLSVVFRRAPLGLWFASGGPSASVLATQPGNADSEAIAQAHGLSALCDLLTDLLTNASQRAGMRRDAMGPELGIVPGQAVFRGTGRDMVGWTHVGLGPGARKGVQVRILSRAPRLMP
jgi:hypothetical protein